MGVKERHGFHMQMSNRATMANWRYESTSVEFQGRVRSW
jgi:hypothetical protein